MLEKNEILLKWLHSAHKKIICEAEGKTMYGLVKLSPSILKNLKYYVAFLRR